MAGKCKGRDMGERHKHQGSNLCPQTPWQASLCGLRAPWRPLREPHAVFHAESRGLFHIFLTYSRNPTHVIKRRGTLCSDICLSPTIVGVQAFASTISVPPSLFGRMHGHRSRREPHTYLRAKRQCLGQSLRQKPL